MDVHQHRIPNASTSNSSINSSPLTNNNSNNSRKHSQSRRKRKDKDNNIIKSVKKRNNDNNIKSNRNIRNSQKNLLHDDTVATQLMEGLDEDMGLPIHILATIKDGLTKEDPHHYQLYVL